MYRDGNVASSQHGRSSRFLGVVKMKTVVFAAGGTGGHIIPALTTARKLKKKIRIVIFFLLGQVVN